MNIKSLFTVVTFSLLLAGSHGCTIIKKLSGSDIDAEQFAKAREAKISEIRLKNLERLTARLQSGNDIYNSDFNFALSRDLITKIVRQYENSSSWLDEDTPYRIKTVSVELNNGSAIASLAIQAYNKFYKVNVNLVMDCLISVEPSGSDLEIKIEPFNISPNVKAGWTPEIFEEIIGDIIKLNLADIGNKLPPLKIPLDIENNFEIKGDDIVVKDKINLLINNPSRTINFKLRLQDVLIFSEAVFLSLNIDKVGVSK